MELLELKNRVMECFEIADINDLKNKLVQITLNHDTEMYDKFCKLVDNDLSPDHLQKVFQYYLADRKVKMQDYTPISLAKLVSKLCIHKEIIDMCAGSGALTIQKWNLNKNCKFKLYEFDENVMPYLLFNLCVRNINAKVYRIDVLTQEVFNEYNVIPNEKYSKVEVIK